MAINKAEQGTILQTKFTLVVFNCNDYFEGLKIQGFENDCDFGQNLGLFMWLSFFVKTVHVLVYISVDFYVNKLIIVDRVFLRMWL